MPSPSLSIFLPWVAALVTSRDKDLSSGQAQAAKEYKKEKI